ncbi:MAG: YhbY family RNA-binding protein [Spirochaetota bacterium]
MKLTGKQRSRLRKLAQDLDPVITVGKNGISDELVTAADEAFDLHELVKVRFSDHKDEIPELADTLSRRTSASIAGKIGHVVIMYRQNGDPEKRRIHL